MVTARVVGLPATILDGITDGHCVSCPVLYYFKKPLNNINPLPGLCPVRPGTRSHLELAAIGMPRSLSTRGFWMGNLLVRNASPEGMPKGRSEGRVKLPAFRNRRPLRLRDRCFFPGPAAAGAEVAVGCKAGEVFAHGQQAVQDYGLAGSRPRRAGPPASPGPGAGTQRGPAGGSARSAGGSSSGGGTSPLTVAPALPGPIHLK